MNFAWPKTKRDKRDEIVELLDREANGSFVVVSRAMDNVVAKHGTNDGINTAEVIEEIRRIRARLD